MKYEIIEHEPIEKTVIIESRELKLILNEDDAYCLRLSLVGSCLYGHTDKLLDILKKFEEK